MKNLFFDDKLHFYNTLEMGNSPKKIVPIVQTSRIFKVFIFALILINIGSMDLNFETVFLCVA